MYPQFRILTQQLIFSLFHFVEKRSDEALNTQSWVRSADYSKLRRRQKTVCSVAIWIKMAFEV